MSARDLLTMPATPRPPRTSKRKAREYLAECFKALRATDDRFAGWWNEATPGRDRERRLLCVLAGVHAGYAAGEWSRLKELDRVAIKRASVEMHAQLQRLMDWLPERQRERVVA